MIEARPRATMRLQLHREFTFDNARGLVAYLVRLGISHVYASPILTARPGSIHGYDVIDPTTVNPEIGGEDGLRRLVADLREAGLGLIVDIVPNHMAVGGSENPWWADVLQHGRASRFAKFFDIDWESNDPLLKGKVLAPFLGSAYGDALDDGQIRLSRDLSGNPVITYFDNSFPINSSDYAHIDEIGLESFDPANPSGRAQIHALLERQHYRLAWWGIAGDEINWRRFFDINGLAGLHTELPEVFEATHATLFRLYTEGLVDGFRIDHVDGLADPPDYCRRLRQRLAELESSRPPGAAQGRAYIVVEKILGAGEALPDDWGVDGTSGYDFMNEVSALQHDDRARPTLEALWHDLTGRTPHFDAEETAARREILEAGFDAQLHAVAAALHHLARSDIHTRDISSHALRRGLAALLAHFPAYRTYRAGERRSGHDQVAFKAALEAARRSAPASMGVVLDHLDRWLGGVAAEDEAHRTAQTHFQQLSAPIAAKAVEDTAFYRYGRLLSRNDVGFDAARLGCSVDDFHQACLRRRSTFPYAMLGTATHDHKRGEDLRARLAVVSELPHKWANLISCCKAIPAERPDIADEIMLYQMVVGAWPLDLQPSDIDGCRAFAERLAGWQQKALREAKLQTSWVTPNEAYEKRAAVFLFEVLRVDGPFVPLLHMFVEQIAPAGAVNSLVQAVLKMTVPGVPDFFQGTDFWDFSLVDPDNRRPVDFKEREAALSVEADPRDLRLTWRDGRIKQAVIRAVLGLRRRMPDVFSRGDYRPLSVHGEGADHIVAFSRQCGTSEIVIVVPRLIADAGLLAGNFRLESAQLMGLEIALESSGEWHSLFGAARVPGAERLSVGSILKDFPLAVLFRADPS